MLKQTIFILIVFITVGLSACAQKPQDVCNKYSEPSLHISFCAPPKWTIVKKPGVTYQEVFGEEYGSTGNINVVAAKYERKLIDLATEMNDLIGPDYAKENGYDSAKFESRSEFSAKTAHGYRSTYISETKGLKIRTIQYLFSGVGEMKIVITATTSAEDKEVFDKIFTTL